MSTVELNVQPILDPILAKLRDWGEVKVWKGQNRKEGHVLVTVMRYHDNFRLDIDINITEALKNDKYFENFFENVVDALEAGQQFRQEDTRIGYLNG